MSRRGNPERDQRILTDLLNGYSVKEATEKYGVSAATANRIRRKSMGPQKLPADTRKMGELEERVKTLEHIIDLFFRGRLDRVGFRPDRT